MPSRSHFFKCNAKSIKLVTVLWGVLALLFLKASVASEPLTADLVRPLNEKEGGKISQLVWTTQSPKVVFQESEGKPRPVAVLDGRYDREGWSLLWVDRVIVESEAPKGKRSFSIQVPLQGPRTWLYLRAVNQYGKVETEVVIIAASGFVLSSVGTKPALASPEKLKPPIVKRSSFSASLGLTTINYQETGIADFIESGLTLKGAFQYYLVPNRWDIAANAYGTVLPLSSSVSGTYLRFFGSNVRIGYVVPPVRYPWRLSLMAGWYFTTTYVTNQAFGFKNMFGPQLFPLFQRSFPSSGTLSFYMKYSPILNGTRLSFQSRELAAGGSWSFRFGQDYSFSISLDLSQLRVVVSDQLRIQSQSATFGVGLGW